MAVLFLIFFWIKSVQNRSNLIKIVQIGFSHQSKNVLIKSCHIYRKDKERTKPTEVNKSCPALTLYLENLSGSFILDFWIRFRVSGQGFESLGNHLALICQPLSSMKIIRPRGCSVLIIMSGSWPALSGCAQNTGLGRRVPDPELHPICPCWEQPRVRQTV